MLVTLLCHANLSLRETFFPTNMLLILIENNIQGQWVLKGEQYEFLVGVIYPTCSLFGQFCPIYPLT